MDEHIRKERRDLGLTRVQRIVLVVSLVLVGGIIVIGLVSAILRNYYSDRAEEARIGVAKSGCKILAAAIEIRLLGGGDIPPGEQAWRTLMESGIIKDPKDFTDPWGETFQLTKDGNDHVVWSKGKDRIGGTSDDIFESDRSLK